ncbi:unnamed protein product [Ambrosiozyma monospora]|uniref:Unnamed protein product n=1 Tax=Ambrosiozyma monospora TaxID=43982 RepID=A0ACB5UBY1_AMBMO|nr:unnamed protein product [Ambrosiozyma monospora]
MLHSLDSVVSKHVGWEDCDGEVEAVAVVGADDNECSDEEERSESKGFVFSFVSNLLSSGLETDSLGESTPGFLKADTLVFLLESIASNNDSTISSP